MNLFRQPWVIILLLVLVVLLFGANKLPGLARNVGKSMRIFKSEVEELRGDEQKGEDDEDDAPRERRSASGSRSAGAAAETSRERESASGSREYDPREETERESVRAREDDDSYRRD